LFGTLEVALPALAHARFGAAGYGTLITCLGAGTIIGTLASARYQATRLRPAVISCIAFIGASLGIAGVPLLGGLSGAGGAIVIFGAATGFGNVIFITMLQKWAPPALLGRVMSMVTFASAGCYPISVFITGILVHGIGITPFFIVAGVLIAFPMSIAITQRRFRDFGIDDTSGKDLLRPGRARFMQPDLCSLAPSTVIGASSCFVRAFPDWFPRLCARLAEL
jgi:MFS family permease